MKVPIIERFRATVAARPDHPGLTCGDRTATFAEVEARSNRLARAYAALGVGYGDLVTVALPNGIDFVEAVLAIWKLGATPQPISWQLPEREHDQIVALAQPSLVVGVAGRADGGAFVATGFVPDLGLSDDELPLVVSPVLRTMTSGGSTGRPKLVRSTDAAEFDFDRGSFPIEDDAVQLVAGPMYHMAPFSFGVLGFLAGHHAVILPRFDPDVAIDAIEHHGVTTAMIVPTMLLRMARAIEDRGHADLSSIRTLWHTGGPCPAWVKERWIELIGGDRLMELYGSTEGVATCMISGTEWLEHRGSVGRPIQGEIQVVAPNGLPVPAGTVGEIYMRRGAGTASPYRYIGAESRRLADGWESIGDLGRLDEDGYLYLADRRTDLIVSGGANIYPAEVEGALGEHPAVAASAVVGLPDADLGQRVHAVVQVVPGAQVDIEDLRSFVSDRLARYKVPRTFTTTDEALANEAGKLRRSEIRDREVERLDVGERA